MKLDDKFSEDQSSVIRLLSFGGELVNTLTKSWHPILLRYLKPHDETFYAQKPAIAAAMLNCRANNGAVVHDWDSSHG